MQDDQEENGSNLRMHRIGHSPCVELITLGKVGKAEPRDEGAGVIGV